MIPRIRNSRGCGRMAVAFKQTVRSIVMKWETPQAVDFRFGMEITMYIAKR
jgi:coenzyme PQQ precursor peptide PqqA